MFYISTRGSAPTLAFDEVLLAGLACDGGLYVPSVWPQVSLVEQVELNNLNYSDLACRLMLPFVGDTIAEDDFAEIVGAAYSEFSNDQVVQEFFGPMKLMHVNLVLITVFVLVVGEPHREAPAHRTCIHSCTRLLVMTGWAGRLCASTNEQELNRLQKTQMGIHTAPLHPPDRNA